MTQRPFPRMASPVAALALATLLAACGGGEDSTDAAGGAATLTLSATTPAAHTTGIDLSTATAKGTSGRAADGFSSVPYCEIFWENANGANGKKYAVQVYFRQGDKLPINVSVIEVGSGWAVFDNNSGAAITGITVDTTARTAVFNSKVLAGSAGEAATLAGTVSFGASAATPACGA
jgi:hypothetical protein